MATGSGNKVAPTSTVLQARVMLYQPSKIPVFQQGEWFKTSFGECRVSGRLGQRHADVMEGMLFVAEAKREERDGGVEILVDKARLRRSLSDSNFSYDQLEKLIEELRSATVTIKAPQFDSPIIGGLIDHVVPSPMTRPNPLNGGERHLWRVRLGVVLVMLLEHDLSLHYSPMPIARLRFGITKAIVRHIFTHKHSPVNGWHLDTLIHAVCGNALVGEKRRKYRSWFLSESADLAEIGIEIMPGNRVVRATDAR